MLHAWPRQVRLPLSDITLARNNDKELKYIYPRRLAEPHLLDTVDRIFSSASASSRHSCCRKCAGISCVQAAIAPLSRLGTNNRPLEAQSWIGLWTSGHILPWP